jgi:RHS repeat-associated protein
MKAYTHLFADLRPSPTFVPDAGVTDQLLVNSASLQQEGDEYVDESTGDSYNPALPEFGGVYTLAMHNGTQLNINATTGDLASIADTNGNTLYFSGQGIETAAGVGVQFQRDYAGRITSISSVDASGTVGQTVNYQYDALGNLIAFTDADNNTTQFTYLPSTGSGQAGSGHYLDTIIDANGVQAARTEYDDQGRVSTVTDAQGNTTTITYDVTGKTQTTHDQLGNPTTTTYDADGNVIRVVNALGGITQSTYDENDRLLSTTTVIGQEDTPQNGERNDLTTSYTYDAFGDVLSTTNPDGTTTRSTYNTFGQPLTQTDALGNTTYYDYDANGNLRDVTDPLGNTTEYTYNAKGQLTGTIDAQGNHTSVTMDSSGNLLSETDGAPSGSGHTTTFTYDAQGNQTGTSTNWVNPNNPSDVRPLTTSTQYDAAGHVTSSTDTQGHTTTTTYTPDGQVATATEPNGDVTENTYDARGELIETRRESQDSDGSIQWLVTRSVYDPAGHVIATTDSYTDGTSDPITGTLTTYDPLGNVTETDSVTGIVIDLVDDGSGTGKQTAVLTDPGAVVTTSTSTYDNTGRELTSTDQYGLQTLTTYDQYGRIIESRRQSIDQNGDTVWLVSRTAYDSLGRVSLATDEYQEGSGDPVYGTQTIYDSLGRAIKTVRLQGVEIDLVNAATGQLVDPLDPQGATINSRVTSTGTVLSQTQTVYNALGQMTRSVAADGEITDYEYDSFGRQTATLGQPVDPASVGLSIPVPDAPGTLVRLRSETVYDSYGQTTATRTNIYEYVLPNGTTQIDRSHEQETDYQYDPFGNVVKTTYPDASTTSATYDSFGNELTSTDQMGQTTTYQYDAENRLTAVILPAVTDPSTGQVVHPTYQYGYDASGNQTSITAPNGGQTTFTYDANGNLLSTTLPLGQAQSTQYDSQGRPVLAVSYEGIVTQSVYDPQTGNLAQTLLYPDSAAYNDGQGMPSETIGYKYDAFGRQVEVDDTVGSGADAVTSTTTTGYDPQGNVLSVTSPQGTVSYVYDSLGRMTKTLIGPVNAPTSETDYTYDVLGRLASVTAVQRGGTLLSTSEEITEEYDLQGNLIQEDLPNGVVDDFTYDNMNRVTHKTEDGPGGAPITEFDYTRRADGLVATETDGFWFPNNGESVEVTNNISYTYDALDRLIDEAFITNADQILGADPTLAPGVRQWETFDDYFAYDLDSNQVQKTTKIGDDQTVDETVTSTYDTNDRLLEQVDTTAAGSTTTEFTYDETQQTSETIYAGTPGALGAMQSSQEYQYDLLGRMSLATVASYTDGVASQIEQLSYGYDTSGNRVSALDRVDTNADGTWDTQTLTEYLNDSNTFTGYPQVLREMQTDPDSGQILDTTEYSLGLRQISQTTTVYTNGQPGTPTTLYFGNDGHGSVRVLTNAAGAIATIAGVRQIFNYDAYGNAIGFNLSAAATTLLYSGEPTDAVTGLQHLGERDLRLSSGTFIESDTYAGDPTNPVGYNKYLYTQADPINRFDPTGRNEEAAFAVLALVENGGGPPSPSAAPAATAPIVSKADLKKVIESKRLEFRKFFPPGLYWQTHLDDFFRMELDAIDKQITRIVVDDKFDTRQVEASANYDYVNNIMTLHRLNIKDISWQAIVHEVTHAVDAQHGWYLTNWGADLDKGEGLAYGAEFIVDSYQRLMNIAKHRKGGGEKDFWTSFNALRLVFISHNYSEAETYTTAYQVTVPGRWWNRTRDLDDNDLADVKQKLGGLEFNYKLVQSYFGL